MSQLIKVSDLEFHESKFTNVKSFDIKVHRTIIAYCTFYMNTVVIQYIKKKKWSGHHHIQRKNKDVDMLKLEVAQYLTPFAQEYLRWQFSRKKYSSKIVLTLNHHSQAADEEEANSNALAEWHLIKKLLGNAGINIENRLVDIQIESQKKD